MTHQIRTILFCSWLVLTTGFETGPAAKPRRALMRREEVDTIINVADDGALKAAQEEEADSKAIDTQEQGTTLLKDEDACPSGSIVLSTSSACKDATDKLGFGYKSGSYTDRPHGCNKDKTADVVWFNEGAGVSDDSGRWSPICGSDDGEIDIDPNPSNGFEGDNKIDQNPSDGLDAKGGDTEVVDHTLSQGCVEHETTALIAPCGCGSYMTTCGTGSFCYKNGCHPLAKATDSEGTSLNINTQATDGEGTSLKKTYVKTYVSGITLKDKNVCPVDSAQLTTPSDCKAAAAAKGATGDAYTSGSFSERPTGCFSDIHGKVGFNSAQAQGYLADPHLYPLVCVKEVLKGTATEPTPVKVGVGETAEDVKKEGGDDKKEGDPNANGGNEGGKDGDTEDNNVQGGNDDDQNAVGAQGGNEGDQNPEGGTDTPAADDQKAKGIKSGAGGYAIALLPLIVCTMSI